MSDKNTKEKHWGICKECKYWQIEPGATVQSNTVGECIENKLHPFLVRITGNGGCTEFEEGAPARAAGSSAKPPTATAMR